jgi:hypothetical protein
MLARMLTRLARAGASGLGASLALGLLAASASYAASVTYSYQGPGLSGSADHLSVSFTTSAPLAASRSYLSQADAGVTSSSVTLRDASGVKTNFNLPVNTFQLHTNASGQIDAWFIFGGFSSLAGSSPGMTGTDRQAYTMNTLVFIPGSDVPGASGLVTGPYAYDQATETQFYASCSGAPAGCTLAGNGQPYVGVYSAILNPSNTNGSWWVSSAGPNNPPPPPPSTVSISGSLPSAQVGVGYSAKLSASGGKAPYVWAAQGLPAGLVLRKGSIAGTPRSAGSFNIAVTATDSAAAQGSAAYVLNVLPALCSGHDALITSVGRNFLVVNGGTQLADHVWYTPNASGTTFTGGTSRFLTGELIDFNGTLDPVAGCYASSMTVKPAATTNSCTTPQGAANSHGDKTVTALGSNFVQAGQKYIDYAACTLVQYPSGRSSPAVGDTLEWWGYVQANGHIMARELRFK